MIYDICQYKDQKPIYSLFLAGSSRGKNIRKIRTIKTKNTFANTSITYYFNSVPLKPSRIGKYKDQTCRILPYSFFLPRVLSLK